MRIIFSFLGRKIPLRRSMHNLYHKILYTVTRLILRINYITVEMEIFLLQNYRHKFASWTKSRSLETLHCDLSHIIWIIKFSHGTSCSDVFYFTWLEFHSYLNSEIIINTKYIQHPTSIHVTTRGTYNLAFSLITWFMCE